MVEICSESLVRAIGKVTPIKTHKGNEKWPLFVYKQLFWWSASITLDNNNTLFLQTCRHFSHLILYHIPHLQLALLVVFLQFFQF